MNSLKWRLSFNQTAKSARSLKLLWQDYTQGIPSETNSSPSSSSCRELLQFVEAVEIAIDSGSLVSWTDEFGSTEVEIFRHFLATSLQVYTRGLPGDEFSITSAELVQRLLFIVYHGLSKTFTLPAIYEDIERDHSLLRWSLSLLQSTEDDTIVRDLIRIVRVAVGTGSIAKLFVQQNGPSILALAATRGSERLSKVHSVISLLIVIVGNTKFADATSLGSQGAVQTLVSRGRTYSNSSAGSSSHGNNRPRLKSGTYGFFDVSDSATGEPFDGQGSDGPWNLFAEVIRLTPFGGSFWPALESQGKDSSRRHLDADEFHSSQTVGMSNSILSHEDVYAERQRIREHQAAVVELSPFQKVKTILAGNSEMVFTIEGAKQLILLASQKAVTPQECINVLQLVTLLCAHSLDNKLLLLSEELLTEYFAMILRVDEGVELLNSCRDQSRAMAMGEIPSVKRSLSKDTSTAQPDVNSNEAEALGLEEYYSKVISALVKLTVDAVVLTSAKSSQLYMPTDLTSTVSVFELCKRFLRTGRATLVLTACRVCLLALSLNPQSAVVMESCGVVFEMFGFVSRSVSQAVVFHQNTPLVMFEAVCGCLHVLQRVASSVVADNSVVLASLCALLLVLWVPAVSANEASRMIKCSNCEQENARFDCLHESCVREACSRLCGECDKVFHKHSSKRVHIRICSQRDFRVLPQPVGGSEDLPDNSAVVTLQDLTQLLPVAWRDLIFSIATPRLLSTVAFHHREVFTVYIQRVLLSLSRDCIDYDTTVFPLQMGRTLQWIQKKVAMTPVNLYPAGNDLELRVAHALDVGNKVLGLWPRESHQPPAVFSKSARRIMQLVSLHSLSVLLFGRTSSSDVSEHFRLSSFAGSHIARGSPSWSIRDAETCRKFLDFCLKGQLDALLVFMTTADNSSSHLTLGDKQACLWLLRELFVLALQVLPSSCEFDLPLWLSYLLESAGTQSSHQAFGNSFPRNTIPWNPLSPLPSGVVTLQPSLSLLVLQEFSCLLSWTDSDHNCPHGSFGQAILEGDIFRSRESSRDSTNQSQLADFHRPSKTYQLVTSICTHRPQLEDHLLHAGILEPVLRICFGDTVELINKLSIDNMGKTLRRFAHRSSARSVESDGQEVFLIALECLCQIIVLFPKLRQQLEARLGNRSTISLIQSLVDSFQVDSPGSRIAAVLSQSLVYYCIAEFALQQPLLPFDRASLSNLLRPGSNNRSADTIQAKTGDRRWVAAPTPRQLLFTYLTTYVHADELRSLCYSVVVPSSQLCSLWEAQGVSTVRVCTYLQSIEFNALPNLNDAGAVVKLVDRRSRVGSNSVKNAEDADDMDHSTSGRNNYGTMPQRRSSRRMAQSVSAVSLENVDSKWELDSTGRSSGAYGEFASRGSMGSNHSVVAIMQALKAMPAEQIMQMPVYGRDEVGTIGTVPSTVATKAISNPPSQMDFQFSHANSGKLQGHGIALDLVCSCSLVAGSLAPVIGALHYALVLRCGLLGWLADVETDSVSELQAKDLVEEEKYFHIIKRHLGPLFPNKHSVARIASTLIVGSEMCVVSARNIECLEVLLAATLLSQGTQQHVMTAYLLHLFDHNPGVMRLLSSQKSVLLVLFRIAAVAGPAIRDATVGMLVKILSFSANVPLLKYLLQFTVDSSADSMSLLAMKVVTRCLDIRAPKAFLQFSPSQSSVKGFSVPLISPSVASFSVTMWLRVDALEFGSIGSLFYLSADSQCLCHVFFRRVHQVADNHDLDNQIDKASLQLCVCLIPDTLEFQYAMTSAPSSPYKPTEASLRTAQQQLVNNLSTSLVGYFLPDYIVDFDWSVEDQNWTLLQIGIEDGTVRCALNGVERRVQAFSSAGYGAEGPEQVLMAGSFAASIKSRMDEIAQRMKEQVMWLHLASCPWKQQEVSTAGMQSAEKDVVTSFMAMSRSIAGLVADVVVTEKPVEQSVVNGWVEQGPSGGLVVKKELTLGYMWQSDILQHAMHKDQRHRNSNTGTSAAHASDSRSGSLLFVQPDHTVASAPAVPPPESKGWLFSYSHNTADVADPHMGRARGSHGERDLHVAQELANPTSFTVFRNAHILDTINEIGGPRLLLPVLLHGPKPHVSAALGIMRCMVMSDADYETFRADHIDNAMCFAFVNMTAATVSDTFQELMGWVVIKSCATPPVSSSNLLQPLEQCVQRPELFAVCADIATLVPGNFSVAHAWLRWMKEMLLDTPSLRSFCRKNWSLMHILHVSSLWAFDNWRLDAGRTTAATASASEDADRRRVNFRSQPASLRNSRTYSAQAVDLQVISPLDSACHAHVVLFHTQRLLRLLFLPTTPQPAQQVQTASAIATILSMAAHMSRRSDVSRMGEPQKQDRENTRKLERLKARLRSSFSTVSLLTRGDCFSDSYWQASAAAVYLSTAVEVLLRDLSLVKSVGVSLMHLAVELTASPVVELRVQAVHLLLVSLATSDGAPDPKRIADAEKLHVFDLIAEQLSNAKDCYDDSLVEAVGTILFWRLQMTVSADGGAAVASIAARPVRSSTVQLEEIALPQMLGVFFRLLHFCPAWEILRLHLLSIVDFRVLDRAEALDGTEERNLDKLFARKDWVLELTDIISAHKRKWQHDDLDANNSAVFSLSESESVGGLSAGSSLRADYLSGGESEDASSAADSHFEDEQRQSPPDWARTQVDVAKLRADYIERFSRPVFDMLLFVLLSDMVRKFHSSARRWPEVFRLASPETSQMLEALMHDLLRSVETVSFMQRESESGFHFLNNLGHLLEQLLEKSNVPLAVVVQVVQCLETLTYRCCNELRARMKDTVLREVRNQCILRGLVEVGQDLRPRVAAVVAMSASLQAYVAQPDTKPLSELQVATLLLGLVLEVFDEVQDCLTARDDSHRVEFVRSSVECMSVLLSLIRTIAPCSADCLRGLRRLFESLTNDPDRVFMQVFFPDSAPAGSAAAATAGGERATSLSRGSLGSLSRSDAELPPAPSSSGGSSLGWWMGWTSTNTRPLPSAHATQMPPQIQTLTQTQSGDEDQTRPTDTRDLVLWFCRHEQRELQAEFKQKLGRELRSALRTAEKLRERASQRLLRHLKTLQDRRSRDRAQAARQVSDGLYSAKSSGDRLSAAFAREVAGWTKSRAERLQLGREVLSAASATVAAAAGGAGGATGSVGGGSGSASSGATGGVGESGSGRGASSGGGGAVGSPSSGGILGGIAAGGAGAEGEGLVMHAFKVPEALLEYLHAPAAPAATDTEALQSLEALHALLECFASARRILEEE